MTDGVTTREVDLDGFSVLVREAGRGAGSPVLCVHGGPGMDSGCFFPDPDAWGPGLRALAERHHVVAYDQRGCGGSGVPDVDQPLALSRHVDDVERVRAALGLGPVAVLGHSFGTVLGLLHALSRPESVTRLILVGGTPTTTFREAYRTTVDEELDAATRERLIELRGRPLTDENLHARFAATLPLYFHRELDADEREALLAGVRFSARVHRALGEALDGFDLRPALPHLHVPTLVVYGEADRVVRPHHQLEFRGALPDARFVAFAESGHFPFLEEPEPFARVVHYFLRHAGRGNGPPTGDEEEPR